MNNKNKVLNIVLIITLIIIITSLALISVKIINPTIKAVVVKSNGNSLTVMKIKDKSLYSIGLPSEINMQFKQGQEILIYCKNGTIINTTYPAQIRKNDIKNIKVLKEKSNIEIPNKILKAVYNNSNNISILVDMISTKGIILTIKDTNEYEEEYEYSNIYYIEKRQDKTLEELRKKSDSYKKVESVHIDSNTIKNTYNWEDVYGKLTSGEYRFRTFTTDGCIHIFIDMIIDIEKGDIKYKTDVTYFPFI